MAAIRLTELTKLFLKAGNLTFGGGDPTVALLHRELVENRQAITPVQYGIAFALARITPGTNVLAFSAAVAYLMRGWPGALLAVMASSIPSALVVLAATSAAAAESQHPLLRAVVESLIAVAVALIASTVLSLVKPGWQSGRRWVSVALVAISAAATYLGLLPPIAILFLLLVVELL